MKTRQRLVPLRGAITHRKNEFGTGKRLVENRVRVVQRKWNVLKGVGRLAVLDDRAEISFRPIFEQRFSNTLVREPEAQQLQSGAHRCGAGLSTTNTKDL